MRLTHRLPAVLLAAGALRAAAQPAPEENRFTRVVLASPLEEPVELAVLPDERVLFVERRGAVKLWSPRTLQVTTLATIPVSLKYTSGDQAEDGLLGLAADPGFARNGFVYMYYSPAGPEPKNVLSRFTMRGDSLDLRSEKVLLAVATQRDQCCHTGGSIAFDGAGNLYLSTGDNTNPFASGYAPIDERPGRSPWDAQKSSANTNDLRGKILRIHPEPDGTYTIPAGNLFPPGTPRTRPEIYTMGHRNPYRIAVDAHTGYVYWGDVGPDAAVDSLDRGPMGHDEVNQARGPGFFGWPYFVGDNKAYWDVDAATMQARGRFDAARPVNDSPNNTGRTDLPPARGAFIWYPYGASAEFPLVGDGGRTAMAGPVFYRADFARAARPWPAYYDRKLLTYDWMRGWVMAVTMDSSGDYRAMERVMPSTKFSNPVDMQFGPSGDLFVLEYGTAWFQGNDDARLLRIQFNAGNRAPVVAASASRAAGAAPLAVHLSSEGTADLDGDSLRYAWTIATERGTVLRRVAARDADYTFARPGRYVATLAATDAKGLRATKAVSIAVGNEPPDVALAVEGNQTFFFPGEPVRYAARVADREDGSLAEGTIPASRVRVTAEYHPDAAPDAAASGAAPARGHQTPSPLAEGKRLVEGADCLGCHKLDGASAGPAYRRVAARYAADTGAAARLARKIRAGGSGVWGNLVMPAHPALTEREARLMAGYVLSLGPSSPAAAVPASGAYAVPGDGAQGALWLRAEYTDRGAGAAPAASGERTLVLRAPTMPVASGTLADGAERTRADGFPVELTVAMREGARAVLPAIDLTDVGAITFGVLAPASQRARGGAIEVRLDSPTGPLLGASAAIAPSADSGAHPVRVALPATTGVHDLHLVFTAPPAPAAAGAAEGPLFAVTTATFERRR